MVSLAWFGGGNACGLSAEDGASVRAACLGCDPLSVTEPPTFEFGRTEKSCDPDGELGERNVVGDSVGGAADLGAGGDEIAANASGVDERAEASDGVAQRRSVGELAVVEVSAAARSGNGQGAREVSAVGEFAEDFDAVDGAFGAGGGEVEIDGEDAAGFTGYGEVGVHPCEPALNDLGVPGGGGQPVACGGRLLRLGLEGEEVVAAFGEIECLGELVVHRRVLLYLSG